MKLPFCLIVPITTKQRSDDMNAAAAAKSLQSCPTLCDPIDGSPPGSPVPGILQARTMEWVAISFSSAWKWKVKVSLLSGVRLFATPWTAAHQAPLSMRFSRQVYWSGGWHEQRSVNTRFYPNGKESYVQRLLLLERTEIRGMENNEEITAMKV